MPIFTKNIKIQTPQNFLKMKTLACVGQCQNFGFGLLKSCLVKCQLLYDKKTNIPPYCTAKLLNLSTAVIYSILGSCSIKVRLCQPKYSYDILLTGQLLNQSKDVSKYSYDILLSGQLLIGWINFDFFDNFKLPHVACAQGGV